MHVLAKEARGSSRKMDGAVASVLSWECRGDAIAAGATVKRRSRALVSFQEGEARLPAAAVDGTAVDVTESLLGQQDAKPGSPLWWTVRLSGQLAQRRPLVDLYGDYYDSGTGCRSRRASSAKCSPRCSRR